MNQKEIRSQLLQEKAAPFSLCIGIGTDGEGFLYISPYQNPVNNMRVLQGISTRNTSDPSVYQGCLVSGANIGLINQTTQAVIESLELAKETATPWLEVQKLEREMAILLKNIRPSFNGADISRYTKRFMVTTNEPLSIIGIIGLVSTQYEDFDKEIVEGGFSLTSAIDRIKIKVAKGKIKKNLKHLNTLARVQNLTQGYCITKYLCRDCPKTAAMINSGQISTLAQFWVSFNTELLAK